MANNPNKPRSLRQWVRHLHPHWCLLLLLIPAAIVEPLKLVGLVVVGSGHWLGGLAMVACAYFVSLSLLTRLFKIVQPQLLTLPWFRTGRTLLRLRRKMLHRIAEKYPTRGEYPCDARTEKQHHYDAEAGVTGARAGRHQFT